jgi:flavin-dependent dehydrogenase
MPKRREELSRYAAAVPESGKYDALILGAGTAGTAAALSLARIGKRVIVVESRALDDAGARWVNGVPLWMFDSASVDRPRKPELREGGRFLVQAHGGKERIVIDPSPAQPVDIRHLGARLRDLAGEAGVSFVDHCAIKEHGLDHGGRLRSLLFERRGESFECEATLFVDASGLNAALRRRVPRLSVDTPRVEPYDLCSAAQYVMEVRAPAAAAAFLASEKLEAGDTLCTLGEDGGFSTANISVEPEAGEAELLTGSIANGEHASGERIVSRLCARYPWLGERRFGGAGAIPLRRPYDRLGAAGLALVGNAACQVFPAHGSGTGIGMIAGRLLARAVATHADIGSDSALWAYQALFHRRYGGLLAFYDLVRRHAQSLDASAIAGLLRDRLINRQSQYAALDQRIPSPAGRELIAMLPGLGRRAREAIGLARALGPGPTLVAHYARYPERPDELSLRRWSRRGAWLRGDRADLSALRVR